jgi:hypothetical protein
MRPGSGAIPHLFGNCAEETEKKGIARILKGAVVTSVRKSLKANEMSNEGDEEQKKAAKAAQGGFCMNVKRKKL